MDMKAFVMAAVTKAYWKRDPASETIEIIWQVWTEWTFDVSHVSTFKIKVGGCGNLQMSFSLNL